MFLSVPGLLRLLPLFHPRFPTLPYPPRPYLPYPTRRYPTLLSVPCLVEVAAAIPPSYPYPTLPLTLPYPTPYHTLPYLTLPSHASFFVHAILMSLSGLAAAKGTPGADEDEVSRRITGRYVLRGTSCLSRPVHLFTFRCDFSSLLMLFCSVRFLPE